MEVNYSLEPWELKAGFILTCQAKPISDKVVVDYGPMFKQPRSSFRGDAQRRARNPLNH